MRANFAIVSPEAGHVPSSGHQRPTSWPLDAPGVTVAIWRGCPAIGETACEGVFHDVRVPIENVLARKEKGSAIMLQTLDVVGSPSTSIIQAF